MVLDGQVRRRVARTERGRSNRLTGASPTIDWSAGAGIKRAFRTTPVLFSTFRAEARNGSKVGGGVVVRNPSSHSVGRRHRSVGIFGILMFLVDATGTTKYFQISTMSKIVTSKNK